MWGVLMYVAVLDIAQYDCPVVKLTEAVSDVKIFVVGVNVSDINQGYEKIYVDVEYPDDEVAFRFLKSIQENRFVKSYAVLFRRSNEMRLSMYIKKTRAMESAVKLDAVPLAPWVSINGVEKWTLGFFSRKQLYEYLSVVKEQDVIEKVKIEEIPDEVVRDISLLYINVIKLINDIGDLTEKQLNILNIAVREGYYEWPRRMNVAELASRMNVSRAAIIKLLRRAESKIMRSIVEFANAYFIYKNQAEERRKNRKNYD